MSGPVVRTNEPKVLTEASHECNCEFCFEDDVECYVREKGWLASCCTFRAVVGTMEAAAAALSDHLASEHSMTVSSVICLKADLCPKCDGFGGVHDMDHEDDCSICDDGLAWVERVTATDAEAEAS